MKKRLALCALVCALGLASGAPAAGGRQQRKPAPRPTPTPLPAATPAPRPTLGAEAEARAGVMVKLREHLLTAPPQELGLEGEEAGAKVLAVLMEMSRPGGVATLVSIRDGTASLYTTTGGAIIGGYVAREQARRFVVEAEKHVGRMKPTESFPYPELGRIRFYLRAPGGVHVADVAEKALLNERHPLFPLFLAGNDVLTGLREATERERPGGRR